VSESWVLYGARFLKQRSDLLSSSLIVFMDGRVSRLAEIILAARLELRVCCPCQTEMLVKKRHIPMPRRSSSPYVPRCRSAWPPTPQTAGTLHAEGSKPLKPTALQDISSRESRPCSQLGRDEPSTKAGRPVYRKVQHRSYVGLIECRTSQSINTTC